LTRAISKRPLRLTWDQSAKRPREALPEGGWGIATLDEKTTCKICSRKVRPRSQNGRGKKSARSTGGETAGGKTSTSSTFRKPSKKAGARVGRKVRFNYGPGNKKKKGVTEGALWGVGSWGLAPDYPQAISCGHLATLKQGEKI